MEKEYGGYLGLEHLAGREYRPDALALCSARAGVALWLQSRGVRRLFLPAFLCDSVLQACQTAGAEPVFYPLDARLRPVFARTLHPGEAFYLVNYYGQLTAPEITAWQAKMGGALLLDNVQAFFATPPTGVDAVYSCRKFFGVPDGGYLVAQGCVPPETRHEARDHMAHLLGRAETDSAEAFYAEYQATETIFDTLPPQRMSLVTHNLLRAVPYAAVRQARRKNFLALHSLLGAHNRYPSLHAVAGAFAYPLWLPDGDAVRAGLQQKKIYVPTLWPEVIARGGPASDEGQAAKNILPLPVDQRYTPADMQMIAQQVLALL